MDHREWGRLRDTVLRRTQASGASREDAEDATHDALVAAIDAPGRPESALAWLSTVARRREVDRVRKRVREQRVAAARPADPDPTSVGPEETVVDRAHARWLAASLTQLPPTTREVVDAVGAGMAPADVARSMNLSPRSVESHLVRARRHLRRLGVLAIPLGALLGWALRHQPGSRTAPAALAVAAPVMVTLVAVLPSSVPLPDPAAPLPAPAAPIAPAPPEPGLATPPPGTGVVPGGPVPPGPAVPAGEPATTPESTEPVPDDPSRAGSPGQPGTGAAGRPGPDPGASADHPAEQPSPRTPGCGIPQLLGSVGCIVGELVDGVVGALP